MYTTYIKHIPQTLRIRKRRRWLLSAGHIAQYATRGLLPRLSGSEETSHSKPLPLVYLAILLLTFRILTPYVIRL